MLCSSGVRHKVRRVDQWLTEKMTRSPQRPTDGMRESFQFLDSEDCHPWLQWLHSMKTTEDNQQEESKQEILEEKKWETVMVSSGEFVNRIWRAWVKGVRPNVFIFDISGPKRRPLEKVRESSEWRYLTNSDPGSLPDRLRSPSFF